MRIECAQHLEGSGAVDLFIQLLNASQQCLSAAAASAQADQTILTPRYQHSYMAISFRYKFHSIFTPRYERPCMIISFRYKLNVLFDDIRSFDLFQSDHFGETWLTRVLDST